MKTPSFILLIFVLFVLSAISASAQENIAFKVELPEATITAQNNAFYAVFLSDGITTLKKIDIATGTAETTAVFGGFPFIDDKLKIYDGKAYFLYANDVSRNKRLYEVTIN